MKKNYFFFVAILVCAMAIVSTTNAQTSMSSLLLTDSKSLEKSLLLSEPAPLINTRAIRDFKRNYPNVDGEKWYTIQDGFVARFSVDNVQHMITYNRSGDWQYTISYYGEKKLPADIRALVKSTYYDYAITGIEEIYIREQIIYVVHMQDESTWKKLRICEGEMSIIEDFNKN